MIGNFLNLIPTLANKLLEETKNSQENKNTLTALKKILLIECRINLKILEVTKNKKIQNPQIFKLLEDLNNESSKALYSYVNNSYLDSVISTVKLVKGRDYIENDPIFVSIISKIELLKLLSKDYEKLQENKIINIKARINNLHKQLTEIVKTLNADITKSTH